MNGWYIILNWTQLLQRIFTQIVLCWCTWWKAHQHSDNYVYLGRTFVNYRGWISIISAANVGSCMPLWAPRGGHQMLAPLLVPTCRKQRAWTSFNPGIQSDIFESLGKSTIILEFQVLNVPWTILCKSAGFSSHWSHPPFISLCNH